MYKCIGQGVETVIRYLQLRSANIIGHSDGSIAALRLAAYQAIHINRLITIGTHWALKADGPACGMYADTTMADWREAFPPGALN